MLIVLLLLTIVFWAIAPIFDKAAHRGGSPLIGTLVRGIVIGAMMLLTLLASGKTKEVFTRPPRSLLFFVLSGILACALGVFTYYRALRLGPASKIVPLASTYPLVTALLSVALLGEHLRRGAPASCSSSSAYSW